MTRRIPPELRFEQIRQRYVIGDALTANFLAAMWASKGDTTRADILREIRDRKLADIATMPPPKDTMI
jgi:hypothetical protein